MFWDSVLVLNKGLVENINNLLVGWALFLLLKGMQICVSEEFPGFKFLPFLIIILGAQVRQARDVEIWFSVRFQYFIQTVSIKEKWKNQKQLRFSPRHFPSERRTNWIVGVKHFPEMKSQNILSIGRTILQLVGSCSVIIIILSEFPAIFTWC